MRKGSCQIIIGGHSEKLPQFPPTVLQGSYYESGGQRKELNPYEQMIMDCARPSIGQYIE